MKFDPEQSVRPSAGPAGGQCRHHPAENISSTLHAPLLSVSGGSSARRTGATPVPQPSRRWSTRSWPPASSGRIAASGPCACLGVLRGRPPSSSSGMGTAGIELTPPALWSTACRGHLQEFCAPATGWGGGDDDGRRCAVYPPPTMLVTISMVTTRWCTYRDMLITATRFKERAAPTPSSPGQVSSTRPWTVPCISPVMSEKVT